MNLLLRISRELSRDGLVVAARAFRKTRHSIGRLAAYVRAVEQLIDDGQQLDDLLDEFEVCAVRPPACVSRPVPDDHSTLRDMLRRMLPPDDARYSRFLNYLSHMNEQTSFEDQLLDQYSIKKEAPSVHAEIQLLHFCDDNPDFRFFAGDPFIAISKPACLCCKLYFRHHPAEYVEPDSHEKVCHNWGPILLPNGRSDPGWFGQRDVLNDVIKGIRREVFKEIEQRNAPSTFTHPDTLTGLTTSDLGDDSGDSDSSSDDGSMASGSEWEVSDYSDDTGSDGGAEL